MDEHTQDLNAHHGHANQARSQPKSKTEADAQSQASHHQQSANHVRLVQVFNWPMRTRCADRDTSQNLGKLPPWMTVGSFMKTSREEERGTDRTRFLFEHAVVGDDARCVRSAVLDQLCKGAFLNVPVEFMLLGVLLGQALHCSASFFGGRKVFEACAIEALQFCAAVHLPLSLRVEMSTTSSISKTAW